MFLLRIILVLLSLFEVPLAVGESLCTLPSYPKNGKYTVLENTTAKPGDQITGYVLKVTCDPGFHLDGHDEPSCLQGFTSEDKLPECIPYCKVPRPNVLSCGAGHQNEESTCYLDQPIPVAENRFNGDELCGKVGPALVKIIAGGVSAKKQELPWHAGIYSKTYSPYMQICGGSLVSSNIVISAAHCFWSNHEKQLPADRFAVAVGKIYRPWNDAHDNEAQKSDVKEIKIPPRFHGSAGNFQDDIALVIVQTAFNFNDFVRPVCLDFDINFDSAQLQDGQLGKIAGWGLISEDGRSSQTLQVAEVPYISIQRCFAEAPPSFSEFITSDKICAGYSNGTASCKGDSGGGLSFPTTGVDSRYFLRGVVSAAPSSEHLCNVHLWAAYTHVLRHEHFIRAVMDEKSSSGNMPI